MALAQNDLSSAVQRRLGTNPANYHVDPTSYNQRRSQVVQGANEDEARQQEAINQRLASQGISDSGIHNAENRQLDYTTRMGAATQQNAIDNDQFDKEFLAQQSEQERNQNQGQFDKSLALQDKLGSGNLGVAQQQANTAEKSVAQAGQLGGRSLDIQQQGQTQQNDQYYAGLHQSGDIADKSLALQDKLGTGNLGVAEKNAETNQQSVTQTGAYQQGTLAQNQQQIDQAASQFAQKMGYDYQSLSQQDKQYFANLAQQQGQFNVSSGQTQQQIDQAASQFAEKMGYDYTSLSQQDKEYFANLAQQQGQFDVTSGQNQQQINNQQEQFGQTLSQHDKEFGVTSGQNQEQIDNQQNQFGQTLAQQGALAGRGLDLQQRGQDIQQSEFTQGTQNAKDLATLQESLNATLYGVEHGYTQGDAASNAEALSYYDKALSGQSLPDDQLAALKTSNPAAYWSYQDGLASKTLNAQAGSTSSDSGSGLKNISNAEDYTVPGATAHDAVTGWENIGSGNVLTGAKEVALSPITGAKKAVTKTLSKIGDWF